MKPWLSWLPLVCVLLAAPPPAHATDGHISTFGGPGEWNDGRNELCANARRYGAEPWTYTIVKLHIAIYPHQNDGATRHVWDTTPGTGSNCKERTVRNYVDYLMEATVHYVDDNGTVRKHRVCCEMFTPYR